MQSVRFEAERNAIATALEKTGWNRKAAARLLKVSYRTLLYKIEQYHMSSSEAYPSAFPGNGTQGQWKADLAVEWGLARYNCSVWSKP